MRLRDKDSFNELLTKGPGFIMTASELARTADVHYSFISHLRTGRKTTCTPATAARIALALGQPIESLFVPKIPTSNYSFSYQKEAV